jgi:hypothetical protein
MVVVCTTVFWVPAWCSTRRRRNSRCSGSERYVLFAEALRVLNVCHWLCQCSEFRPVRTLAEPNSVRKNSCSWVARSLVVCGTGFASVVIRGWEPDHWQSQCHAWLIAELRKSCRTLLALPVLGVSTCSDTGRTSGSQGLTLFQIAHARL